MESLLEALRAEGVPVQKLGIALQTWLYQTQQHANAIEPDYMAEQLAVEDVRGVFRHLFDEDYRRWEPDADELAQEEKSE